MKGITGFGHAAIKVKDLDASLAFYRDRLGFPEMLRLHNKDGSTWLVYLRITDEVFLEIFPGAEKSQVPRRGCSHWIPPAVNAVDRGPCARPTRTAPPPERPGRRILITAHSHPGQQEPLPARGLDGVH